MRSCLCPCRRDDTQTHLFGRPSGWIGVYEMDLAGCRLVVAVRAEGGDTGGVWTSTARTAARTDSSGGSHDAPNAVAPSK